MKYSPDDIIANANPNRIEGEKRYMELVGVIGRFYLANPRVAEALVTCLQAAPDTGSVRISFRDGKPHSCTQETVVY